MEREQNTDSRFRAPARHRPGRAPQLEASRVGAGSLKIAWPRGANRGPPRGRLRFVTDPRTEDLSLVERPL